MRERKKVNSINLTIARKTVDLFVQKHKGGGLLCLWTIPPVLADYWKQVLSFRVRQMGEDAM